MQRYRPGLFKSIYQFVLSHLVTDKIKKIVDKIEISKIVFLIFHESLFQKTKNLFFCKDIVQDYSTVSTILFYLIWLQIKSKKLIDKIEISKNFFLIFHESLFQKNKNLYFCKDIVQDYSKVFTNLFYLIWLRAKSKKLIDNIEISKNFFLIFHESLSQKNKNLYFCKDIVQDYSTVSTILFYLIWLRIKSKKNDWLNGNFQNCFPHISWKPVPKK